METIHWKKDMALGVPAMDLAHKALLFEMERLAELPDEQFVRDFLAMVASMERDFREEELLMEDIDYPGLQGHQEQHARVLGALHHVVPQVMGGDIAIGREAAALLPQWFLFHLSTMDTALAFALDIDDAETTANAAALRAAAERLMQERMDGGN